MQRSQRRIRVLAPDIDRILYSVTPEEALNLVQRGQVSILERSLRLKPTVDSDIPMRTRTGRVREDAPEFDHSRLLAAMGQSQVYTTQDTRPGKVDGFKDLYPEDLHIFHAATLGGWV